MNRRMRGDERGSLPGGISLPCDSASENAEFGVSRALGPPMRHMWSSAGNGATSGIPVALGTGRDEVNNPLYWRLKPAARELSGRRHKGLKLPIRGNSLTKN